MTPSRDMQVIIHETNMFVSCIHKYVLVIHCLKKVYATLGACILSTASRGRLLRKRSESIKAGEKTSLLFMSLVNTFLIRLWSQSSASSLTDYSMMFILCMMSH